MSILESYKEYRNYQAIVRKSRCWLYIFFYNLDKDLAGKGLAGQSKDQVLNKIANWTIKYTPTVSTDPPSGILLDITGTERLLGSPESLSKKIYLSILKNGFSTSIGIAPTIGAAWGLARFNTNLIYTESGRLRSNKANCYPITIAQQEDYLDLFSQLPIQALRIESKISETLHEVGIRIIKDLLLIPRAAISQRFGLKILNQLDLALGVREEIITPFQIEREWRVIRCFDNPIYNISAISQTIIKLVGNLCDKLRSTQKTATILKLEIIGNSRTDHKQFNITKEFKLVSAADDPKLITLLTTPFLEKLVLPGAIHKIILEALDVQNNCEKQLTIEGDSQVKYDLNELVNRLIGQFGQQNIRHIQMHESYLPEKSFAFEVIESLKEITDLSDLKRGELSIYIPSNRPPVLLKAPQEISVIALLPDAIPAQIQLSKTNYRIIEGIGPEKIATEWWDLDETQDNHYMRLDSHASQGEVYDLPHGAREYFKVQDEYGRWLWIFRIEDSMRWFLHGLWP